MPQLDFVSFFNQIFWLFLIFVLFYTFFFKNFVPFLLRVFKTRFKKLGKASKNAEVLVTIELPTAKLVTETIFMKAVSELTQMFSVFSNKVDSWVNAELLAIQIKAVNVNMQYVYSLQELFLQKYLLQTLIRTIRTETKTNR